MRIIFLNSWFGKAGRPFINFIKSESSKTDIFCLMEVPPKLFSELSMILKEFKGVYDDGLFLKAIGANCGQAVFVKNNINLLSNGRVEIYRQLKDDMGFMQYLELERGQRKFWIGSIHGKTRPGDKKDTETRLKQSKIIINFFDDKNGPVIFGGDFNLMPETRSVVLFEKAGFRNLIKDYEIKDTRGPINHKNFLENDRQYFADYVFVSPDVKIKKFEVPYIGISDHLPLILDFDLPAG